MDQGEEFIDSLEPGDAVYGLFPDNPHWIMAVLECGKPEFVLSYPSDGVSNCLPMNFHWDGRRLVYEGGEGRIPYSSLWRNEKGAGLQALLAYKIYSRPFDRGIDELRSMFQEAAPSPESMAAVALVHMSGSVHEMAWKIQEILRDMPDDTARAYLLGAVLNQVRIQTQSTMLRTIGRTKERRTGISIVRESAAPASSKIH
jgi:hypothetical protein